MAVAQAIQEPLLEPVFLERFFEGCGSWSSVLSFSAHSRYQELQTNILPWTSIPHISSQISLRPICELGDNKSVSHACKRGGTLTVAGWRRGNRGKVLVCGCGPARFLSPTPLPEDIGSKGLRIPPRGLLLPHLSHLLEPQGSISEAISSELSVSIFSEPKIIRE